MDNFSVFLAIYLPEILASSFSETKRQKRNQDLIPRSRNFCIKLPILISAHTRNSTTRNASGLNTNITKLMSSVANDHTHVRPNYLQPMTCSRQYPLPAPTTFFPIPHYSHRDFFWYTNCKFPLYLPSAL